MPCDPEVVERARSFALVAEEYERGRPGYPAAAIRWLLGDRPLVVADLGAGTGKLSAAVVGEGHRVIAVEPLAEMRTVLEDRVPQADVRAGTAERTGLPDASVDAVVAGAAFHWFDRSRAFPEIARILPPRASSACSPMDLTARRPGSASFERSSAGRAWGVLATGPERWSYSSSSRPWTSASSRTRRA